MTGNSTIYNATDGPLIIDRAGRVLGGRERREDVDVTASPIAGHIAAGRIVVVEEAQAEAVDGQPVDEEQATDEDLGAPSPAPSSRKTGRRPTSPAPTTEEA